MSLFMTGIGPVLETARRNACASKLQELCTAASSHELSRERLPGYLQSYGSFSGGSDPSDPGNFGGNVPAHVKLGSWHVGLLQYMDNQPLYEFWTMATIPNDIN